MDPIFCNFPGGPDPLSPSGTAHELFISCLAYPHQYSLRHLQWSLFPRKIGLQLIGSIFHEKEHPCFLQHATISHDSLIFFTLLAFAIILLSGDSRRQSVKMTTHRTPFILGYTIWKQELNTTLIISRTEYFETMYILNSPPIFFLSFFSTN